MKAPVAEGFHAPLAHMRGVHPDGVSLQNCKESNSRPGEVPLNESLQRAIYFEEPESGDALCGAVETARSLHSANVQRLSCARCPVVLN